MIGYMIVVALVIIAVVSVFIALSVEATDGDTKSQDDASDRDGSPLEPS